MKKVIVFFNAEPAVVVTVMKGITTIMREFPNGEKAHLPVMSAGFPSLTGDHKIVYVASDRDVSSEEILEAASKLLK
ncbi:MULTISPECIES: hypothetical protein [Enterobacteriaceae]|jgi:hypothetical protein|nr:MULTISPECIES: hypothetical protein [Enterobacteriaceae]AVH83693.1 hypothetical protein A6J81_25190 [Citrobacter braakii]MDT3759613.1 hypothetical protein [Citrobacter freundii complex sp. 2023EL-00962]MDU7722339.1 hypothetical protein [Citrobacter sp.]POV68724.1 hypothetical protein C3404_00420 [Citrobacter freundii complex sp. CFNIH11]RNL75732.1 hypothetical protein D7I40_00940 [Citrobacter sp. MH181794]RRN88326.1 hypothetical protein D2048_18680 [Morganella morganii]DAY48490.1 MAG TPA: 